MQVTDEMARAAWHRWIELEVEGGLDHNTVMREAVQAALDAMPKATGGLVPGPDAISDRCFPRLADVTAPEKVRRAADAVPGMTFNLNMEYGGVDEAAAKKLRLDVSGSGAQDDSGQEPQAADGD